jgi:hypothetical protein
VTRAVHTGLAAALAFALGTSPARGAEDLQVSFRDGRVTIVADQVPIRQVLEEWARVGSVRVVNLEKLTGPPVTLRLVDVPEGQALDTLLRSAAGYLAATRRADHPGASRFDRVVILATSRPPAPAPSAPAFSPAVAPRAMPLRPDLGEQPPAGVTGDEPDVTAPGRPMPSGPEVAPPLLPPNPPPFPGTGAPQASPEQVPVLTAPQPGIIPAPPSQPQAPTVLPQPGFAPVPSAPTTPGGTPPGAQPPKKPGGGG